MRQAGVPEFFCFRFLLLQIVTDWAKAVACEERVPPRRVTATVLTYGSYTLGVSKNARSVVMISLNVCGVDYIGWIIPNFKIL